MQILEAHKFLYIALLLLFIGISSADRIKRQIIFEDNENRLFNADCRTPDGRPGRCVRFTTCGVLLQGTNRNILRRYFCGFEGDEPKVCCPQPRNEVVTPRPTLRTTPRTTLRTTIRTTRRPTRRTTVRFDDEPRNAGHGTTQGPRPDSLTRPSFLPKTCGVTLHTQTRVVGGSRAERGSWPWMAVVFVRKNNGDLEADCGGALVTNQHVITAAHCVVTGRRAQNMDPSRLLVRLGAYNISVPNEREAVDVEVEAVRRHARFESRTYKNDIAVLKLKRPVTFSKTISPVCLPYDSLVGEDITQKSVIVIGYGTTAFNGNSSDVLMQALFYIQDQEICKKAYERELVISNVYLCAGMMDGSKDACQGDSGGPLLTVGKNNSYYLIGIVSFGRQCAQPNYPGVYTRVTEFLDWLTRNLSD